MRRIPTLGMLLSSSLNQGLALDKGICVSVMRERYGIVAGVFCLCCGMCLRGILE